MIVEEIMKTQVTTLSPESTIKDACNLIEEKKIRHLPVVQDGQLVGLVTDRDIRDALPSIFITEENKEILLKPVAELMTKDLITCHPLDFVEEVAALLYEHHIGCLPVVNGTKLVGIVTETDMLHTLVELTGAHQPGSQIEVKVPNRAGILNSVASIISKRKANISSVLVYPDRKDPSQKILVFRVQTMNPISLIENLESEGFKVLWPNHPGVSS